MPPLLVIVGATGAGKTDLAIRIAEATGGQIVSADSQQVYRGMDIGTGKASSEQQRRVAHHLLDVVNPDEEMTAARFVELADQAIAALSGSGTPTIVAGGTMLYVRALLRGLFEGPARDAALRSELEQEAAREGVAALWQRLRQVDLESARRIHDTDKRRLIRAIEVYRLTGIPLSEHHRRHRGQPARHQARLIGLQPPRDALYEQINARVLSMMEQGLIEEVRGLREQGYGPDLRSQQAIGYGEVHRHLAGELDLAETVSLVQRNSRRYARRQLSWYRGDTSIEWLEDASAVDLEQLGGYLVGSDHD